MVKYSKATWLNNELLANALQGKENQDVEVVSWKCEPAVPSGLNYQSQLFRVVVEFRVGDKECTTSIIAKVPLEDGCGKESVDSFNGTEREVRMYHEVLPEMTKLHPWRGAPKALPPHLPDIIIMEDLKEQGYRLYPRGELLDFHHCKEVLLNLSTFHAISVRLYHDSPESIESVGPKASLDHEDSVGTYWKKHLGKFASRKECAEFASRIRKNSETFDSLEVELFKPSKILNVLTHADMWINNIMFRYDESGTLLDSKLVDFQAPKYCSFAADLVMMWWSSGDLNVRELHQEELFEVYRQNLNKTLEEVDCLERLSKEDFDTEIKRFSPYALRPVSIHLEFALRDRYRKLLPSVLKQLESCGVFPTLQSPEKTPSNNCIIS